MINNSKQELSIRYENSILGFSLEIPSSWEGNYLIHEYDDFIDICFIGQSEASKEMFDETDNIHGLSMFCIGKESYINENEFLDSIYEVGVANGIKYYHFTGTDYPLGALAGEYIEDENEKVLAASDLIKAEEMEKDKELILSTFKELE